MNSEQFEQIEEAPGNTESGAKKTEYQYNYWFFTLNNYEAEVCEQLEQVFKHECKWYVFQEEIGEKGTPHLQGTISLKVKQRLSNLKKIDPRIHWEHTKSVKGSVAYCSKEASRNGKQWVYGIDLPEKIKTHAPRAGWQTDIVDLLNKEPDERTIHWYWENIGNVGKTTLCKYLVVEKDALMLTGKSSDMFHMISKFPTKRKLIIIDCPRSSQDFINYGAIEQIKNGLIFSGKYEGTQLVFNCPHVVVFSNREPDYEKMSADRWNVVQIQ